MQSLEKKNKNGDHCLVERRGGQSLNKEVNGDNCLVERRGG